VVVAAGGWLQPKSTKLVAKIIISLLGILIS
jgi:hypothetical protein